MFVTGGSGRNDSPESLRVVLLEDDPNDAALVEIELRKSGLRFDLRRVDSRAEFTGILAERCPDLILADHALPAFTGVEALKIALERCPGVPFLFVSGHIGEDRAIDILKSGATDYVLKDNLARLASAVERAIRESRQRAARAEAEEALRQILGNALDAVVTMGADGRVAGWNAEAEKLFGWKADEAIGRSMADLIIPERYREAHQRGLRHFLDTGQGPILGRRIEIHALHRDGRELLVELTVTPIQAGGRPFFSAFLRDIADRKRAQTRLEAEHAVGRILADAPTLETAVPRILESLCRILEWDLGAYWTPGPGADELRLADIHSGSSSSPHAFIEMCRTFRFKPGVGLPGRVWKSRQACWIEDVVKDANFPRAAAAVKEGLHGAFAFPIVHGEEFLGVMEFLSRETLRPDAELLEVTRSIGRQIGSTAARRRAEEDLRKLNQDLERRVAERTAELDAFTYSVAHDLRAPLRSMRGFSDALLEECAAQLGAEGQDYARRISAAGGRMNALIEDLLAYSRLTREEIPLAPVALSEVVRGVLGQMAAELAAAEVVLGDLPREVRGHALTLRQVLLNLLSNANKFVGAGVKPRIGVRAELRDGWVRLWVEDNGIGIAPEYHERIFRVFERLHGPEEYPGTGVGLAIVKKAMERMGGRCGVESEPGQGSRFWIELPQA